MRDAPGFARLVTRIIVRRPYLWRLVRGRLRGVFDELAPTWETRLGPQHLAALELALDDVPAPGRALDIGTGTGIAAKELARRYPDAEVLGVDLSPRMVEQARQRLPEDLSARVRFEVADASALACEDGAFDLVTLASAFPFFDELARVVRPGGLLVISYSLGAQTPVYVEPETLRRELGRRGFAEFAEFSAPPATALRATRQ